MTITVKGLSQFQATFTGWLGAVQKSAEVAALSVAREAVGFAAANTPQWSGDMAANWKLSTGSPKPFQMNVFNSQFGGWRQRGDWRKVSSVFKLGDAPAVAFAVAEAAGEANDFKLGQSLYITNSAYHPEDSEDGSQGVIDPYAWKVEAGLIHLRPVNQGGAHIVRRTLNVMSVKYRQLGFK